MQKTLFLILGLALLALLAGCAASTPAPAVATLAEPPATGAAEATVAATTTPAATLPAGATPTADTAVATPATGFVDALANVPQAYLYTSPTDSAQVVGQLLMDKHAELLGVDASGAWFLIRVDGTTAWVSAARVRATISQ